MRDTLRETEDVLLVAAMVFFHVSLFEYFMIDETKCVHVHECGCLLRGDKKAHKLMRSQLRELCLIHRK